MKTKTIFQLIIAFTTMLVFNTSCSVEKLVESFECNADALFEEASVEKIFFQEALNAYSIEQSAANCQELKTSGNAYINAVQLYIDCSEAGDEQVKRELKEAKAALANLEC